MSEVALKHDDLDGYVRDRVEIVLVGASTKSDYSLHLPKSSESHESICRFYSQASGYRRKSIDAYPAGHAPFCSECVEKRFGVEVVDR